MAGGVGYIYPELVANPVVWKTVLWKFFVVGSLMFLPWLGLVWIGVFLSSPDRKYRARFQRLLGVTLLVAVIYLLKAGSSHWMARDIPALALMFLVPALGLLLVHFRQQPVFKAQPPSPWLSSNRGFLFALALAAFAGIDAGGRGLGITHFILVQIFGEPGPARVR
jgi:hypothetical protein